MSVSLLTPVITSVGSLAFCGRMVHVELDGSMSSPIIWIISAIGLLSVSQTMPIPLLVLKVFLIFIFLLRLSNFSLKFFCMAGPEVLLMSFEVMKIVFVVFFGGMLAIWDEFLSFCSCIIAANEGDV